MISSMNTIWMGQSSSISLISNGQAVSPARGYGWPGWQSMAFPGWQRSACPCGMALTMESNWSSRSTIRRGFTGNIRSLLPMAMLIWAFFGTSLTPSPVGHDLTLFLEEFDDAQLLFRQDAGKDGGDPDPGSGSGSPSLHVVGGSVR